MKSAALFAVGLGVSCAQGRRPQDTVVAYRQALVRGDARAAYALLSKEVRQKWSLGDFSRRWQQTQAGREEDARLLRTALPMRFEAHLAARDQEIVLRGDGQSWWMEQGALAGDSLRSPEATLRALGRAVERGDYKGFLRLLSGAKRDRWQNAVRNRLNKITAYGGQTVRVESDRVTIQYAPLYRIWLVREGQQWKVDDLE